MRRVLLPALAAVLIAPIGGVAVAQDAPAAEKAQPTEAELRRGAIILRAFDTVISSDEADDALKAQLFTCIYNNSVSEIGAAAGQVLAANEKMDPADPQQVYAAAAVACGVKPTVAPDAVQGR